jgi:hypothetical protein
MKSTADVKRRAGELKEPFVEFMRKELGDFGEVVDQLRVLGYLCEAMMKLAETELIALKLLDDHERPKIILAS